MSDLSSSPPASLAPRTPRYYERTNTLTIAPVPKEFFQEAVLTVLKNHFSNFGEINQWVPLSSFFRIIVVFDSEDAAENAKLLSDPITIDAWQDRFVTSLLAPRSD
jgi:hypothetical protein